MDVYVINLDRHLERWSRLKPMLADQGLVAHRVQAIEGQRLADRTSPAAPRPGALPADRTVLSRYEIACVLSHRRVWRRFLRSPARHCVVLEDDVHLGEDFGAFVTDPALLTAGFEIIKLETFAKHVATDASRPVPVGERRLVRLRSHNPGSAGYMLTRASAARLLALSRNAPDSADSLIFNCDKYATLGVRHFKVGQVAPAPVIQHMLLEDAPAMPILDSYIAGHRGKRVKHGPVTLRKLRREALRPLAQLWFALSKVAVEFR